MKSWNLSTIHFYILWLWSLICSLIFHSGVGQSHPMQIPFSQPVVYNEFPPSLHHFNLRFDIHLTFPGDKDLRLKKKNIPLGPVETTGHNVEKANFCNIIYICMNQAKTWNQSRLSNINLKPAVFHTCSSQLWHNLACSSLENQISILVLGTTEVWRIKRIRESKRI